MLRVADIPDEQIVFYDIETTSVHAVYCHLKMIAYQVGFNSEPELVDPNSKESMEAFRELMLDSNIWKVSYNGINFDDVVLWRYGFYVEPKRRLDMYLAMKTIHPTFPSYSLKFVNWAINNPCASITDAWHEPEAKLDAWLLKRGLTKNSMYTAPQEILAEYCKHDVRETANVFRAVWEIVQSPQHWRPYQELELAMGEPLHEMMLLGMEYVSPEHILERIRELKIEREEWNQKVRKLTNGKVQNAASSKQVSRYLVDEDKIELEITDEGNFQIRKADLLDFLNLDDESKDKNRIARCCYEARDVNKVIGYLRSYYRAARYEQRKKDGTNSERKNGEFHPINLAKCLCERRNRPRNNQVKTANGDSEIVAIPKSFYLSAARTRRILSKGGAGKKKTKFSINWQNQNKRSKAVQLVPPGWIAFYLDSTQIENVVHIYESKDKVRRASYEADPNWSEYVWLTNTVLGGNRTRKELEEIDSPENPQWSVYKQYKTIKLAMNFGMGPDKFTKTTGLARRLAVVTFDRVHVACPAIRKLQNIVRNKIKEKGYVEDPFGHIYSGKVDKAYKIVAYLIQGCGTGSIPKAMTVANYETLHSLDSDDCLYYPCIKHPYTKRCMYGVLCGTTHDECSGRISLGLSTRTIIKLIKQMIFNMEERFSYLFDNIPLRAKLAVSITNAAEQEEIDHRKDDFETKLGAMIIAGKKLMAIN